MCFDAVLRKASIPWFPVPSLYEGIRVCRQLASMTGLDNTVGKSCMSQTRYQSLSVKIV